MLFNALPQGHHILSTISIANKHPYVSKEIEKKRFCVLLLRIIMTLNLSPVIVVWTFTGTLQAGSAQIYPSAKL